MQGIIKLLASLPALILLTGSALAQTSPQIRISWEVANRFRLFAEQKDFDLHVAAWQSDSNGVGKSILETERILEKPLGGSGWSSKTGRLCYNKDTGLLLPKCSRDGAVENYLNPDSHLIIVRASLPPEFSSAQCTWTIGDAAKGKPIQQPCNQAVTGQRAPDRKSIAVHVEAKNAAGQTILGDAAVLARDYLIVGLGDSIASGEGNPDQPVELSDIGFCFKRVLNPIPQFYLPGRAKANVATDCVDENPADFRLWEQAAAGWLYAACHRSLYSYQVRAALALAVENPDISVTFIPLGCTGATIKDGLLKRQMARERPVIGGKIGPSTVPAQLDQLAKYLGADTGKPPIRPVDLIFLTVGANDIQFSNLVADVMVTQNPERAALIIDKMLSTPNDEQTALYETLKANFEKLRSRLAPFVDGNLQRVLFVAYGDPAQYQGAPCPTSRVGFDAHPAFSVDGDELKRMVEFVEEKFFVALKNYAICGAETGCSDPAKQRMTFVADHQPAFLAHGFCAADESDPDFDKVCFRNGGSFAGPPTGLTRPLTCRYDATRFRPYVERARWIRTANDSYFTAMTYPWTGRSFLNNPSDIHDGRWGLTSVVYGGALHPTAEGHAAMADAALAAAKKILNLPHNANAETAK